MGGTARQFNKMYIDYKQQFKKPIHIVEPQYTQAFIDHYFNTNDLHERLEIIRELSKYKSDKIIKFFYKVNT